MANSPSETWEDGRMVARASETNRWRVNPDGSEVDEKEEVEATATKPYRPPVKTAHSPEDRKAVQEAENKAVAARRTTKKTAARR